MSKIAKLIEKDYRGGKLGKVQRIVDELINDANKALEEAKEIGIAIIESETRFIDYDLQKKARLLLVESEVKNHAAKRIFDLLGRAYSAPMKDDEQELNMDHIEA